MNLESTLRKNLLRLARAYSRASGLKLASISQYAISDSKFFTQLGEGSSFTARKYDQLVKWFARQDWKGHQMPVLIDPKHQQKGGAHGAQSSKEVGQKVGSAKVRKAGVGKTRSEAAGKARR